MLESCQWYNEYCVAGAAILNDSCPHLISSKRRPEHNECLVES